MSGRALRSLCEPRAAGHRPSACSPEVLPLLLLPLLLLPLLRCTVLRVAHWIELPSQRKCVATVLSRSMTETLHRAGLSDLTYGIAEAAGRTSTAFVRAAAPMSGVPAPRSLP